MGFADLSIAEIAAEYDLPPEEGCHLGEQLGIAYKSPPKPSGSGGCQSNYFYDFVRKTGLSHTS
jgi:hypothetical protein